MSADFDRYALLVELERLARAPIVAPRDLATRELENVQLLFEDPVGSRWLTFPARKLSLDYVRAELRWYLDGDPADLSILERAVTWRGIVAPDGTLNSNYGRAWFRDGQLARCYHELTADPSSRRACALIPTEAMFARGVRDVPCTVYQSFRVRNDRLNASTHMRSQDVIFGLGNDLPAFTMVQELLAAALGVDVGTHALTVDSWHVYERHFEMLARILIEEPTPVDCPRITAVEGIAAVSGHWRDVDGPFFNWLRESA